MKETLKTFTEDLAKELKAKLQSSDTAEFIATVKASGDDRTFEVVMSTADEDRQGDSLDQSNWDLKYFDMNPVVLWAHNYSGFPIGVVTDIVIDGDKAVATGKFVPAGINPEADMACALYQQKILRAVSPGYIQNDDGTRELLELSFCPVPAGKYALSLRQVRALGVSTRELVTKGFYYDEKAIEVTKTDQVGDSCQQDDGTPGVLAEGDSPGVMICVPLEDKAEKSNEAPMKKELIKQFQAEHGRHGEAVAKAIDTFTSKSFDKDGGTGNDTTKDIEEFTKAIEDEQADHLDKCMKAIDESAEEQKKEAKGLIFGAKTWEEVEVKKAIEDFKKSVTGEHLAHVKNVDKAIDEFKDAWADGDDSDRTKAIEDFTKSAGTELDRHQTASMDLCKAEMGEGETDEEKSAEEQVAEEVVEDTEEKAFIEEATSLGIEKSQASSLWPFVQKSGRTISAATTDKVNAIIKSLEDHDAEDKASTTTAIASLKDLIGPPKEDDGEEQKPDEKSAPAPKQRSSTSGAAPLKTVSLSEELESYLFVQRLVRQIKTASENGLRQINEKLSEARKK